MTDTEPRQHTIEVLDPDGHEPSVLLVAEPGPAGGVVEIDVDGRAVRVRWAELVDAVAACGAELTAGVVA